MKQKKVHKKVQSIGKISSKLTPLQTKVYDMWVGENLTVEQISKRRQTTIRNTYQIIKKIRKKGYDKLIKNRTSQKGVQVSSLFRYHSLHLTVKPYYKYPRYDKYIGSVNVEHGYWLVTAHKDMLEFRLKRNHNIKHKDRWECIRQTRDNFNKKLEYVAAQYGFEYRKDKRVSIVCVNGHLAKGNSVIAKARHGEHLLISGDDGKVWFEIDMSEGYPEHEYRHPVNHINDSEKVERFFNDLRDNEYIMLSELSQNVVKLSKIIVELGYVIKSNTYMIQALIPKPIEYENGKYPGMKEYIG